MSRVGTASTEPVKPPKPTDARMRARVCLLDWDGTVRHGYVIVDWLRFLMAHGLFPEVSAAKIERTVATMKATGASRDAAVARIANEYALGLKGQPSGPVYRASIEFAKRELESLFGSTRPICALLRSCGINIVVVTGAPNEAVAHTARALDVQAVYGIMCEVGENDRFTGRVLDNHGTRRAKEKRAALVARESDVALAIGDSVSDVPLFRAARSAIRVHDRESPVRGGGDAVGVVHDELLGAVRSALAREA